jgi:hypothetical protein
MEISDLAPVLQYAGDHGPYLFVIGLLLRSVIRLNEQLQANNQQLLEMAVTAQKALTGSAERQRDG